MNAALWYARHGFAIFPVAPGKAPLTPNGFKNATTDLREITAWWKRWPAAAIAVRCDWFFVVDVDMGTDKSGAHILDGWRKVRGEFLRTWQARTGSGGSHFFFEHDAALDSIPLGTLYKDAVDVKGGSRGYVLLAPSRNKNGVYKWIVSPREAKLAKAPRWLVDEIVRVKRPRTPDPIHVDLSRYAGVDRVERARRYARAVSPAVEGDGGHFHTFRVCVCVAKGFALNEDEAFAVLAREWNPRCRPQWSESDLRRQIKGAIARGDMTEGELLQKKGRAA